MVRFLHHSITHWRVVEVSFLLVAHERLWALVELRVPLRLRRVHLYHVPAVRTFHLRVGCEVLLHGVDELLGRVPARGHLL